MAVTNGMTTAPHAVQLAATPARWQISTKTSTWRIFGPRLALPRTSSSPIRRSKRSNSRAKPSRENPGKFGFSPADCGYLHLQEIRIVNEDGEELLHLDDGRIQTPVSAPQLLKALETQVEITREIIDAWNKTDKLTGAVQDLIYALESQTECAQAVLEPGRMATSPAPSTISKNPSDYALKTIADAKGGAA